MTGKELEYLVRAYIGGHLSGNGPFTKQCHAILKSKLSAEGIFLTHSCTAALEMTAILFNISYNDEILMPSFTYVSITNAFVLRGGIPVFIDIREDTLNINKKLLEKNISKNTKAIVSRPCKRAYLPGMAG
jgi:dTDP-4-amino-4,6-dideoxygalactose transaminase